MSISEWSDPNLADTYAGKAADPAVNWFEYEVNVPAMLAIMPSGAQHVLDFGCGAGDVTTMLADRYPKVEGCDPSAAMLEHARHDFPGLTFFTWDATQPLPDKQGYYDAVFSKLALHFVPDLRPVASNLFGVLGEGGSLVFSVPHPFSTVKKTPDANYWQQASYQTPIGSYGVQVTMIHRSLEEYIAPFTEAGFVLTTCHEPRIPADIAHQNNAAASELAAPKRLNIRLTKP